MDTDIIVSYGILEPDIQLVEEKNENLDDNQESGSPVNGDCDEAYESMKQLNLEIPPQAPEKDDHSHPLRRFPEDTKSSLVSTTTQYGGRSDINNFEQIYAHSATKSIQECTTTTRNEVVVPSIHPMNVKTPTEETSVVDKINELVYQVSSNIPKPLICTSNLRPLTTSDYFTIAHETVDTGQSLWAIWPCHTMIAWPIPFTNSYENEPICERSFEIM